MTDKNFMVQLKERKLKELAEIELKKAQGKISYAEKLLAEVKEITQLLEELLNNENSL